MQQDSTLDPNALAYCERLWNIVGRVKRGSMNFERLAARDPNGEVKVWFERIEGLL